MMVFSMVLWDIQLNQLLAEDSLVLLKCINFSLPSTCGPVL